MLYAVCYRKKKHVCVFLSVREPAVTVHLTGFFHTPKLLQPQLRNPENCKQAIQGLEFHTSLNSLLYHIIAFNWFSVVFKCNLWHELERCQYYKVYVFFFFFFFNLTVMRYLKISKFAIVCAYAARLGSFITGAFRQVVY